MTLRDRLLAKVVIDQETGCLLWTGSRQRNGYGQIGAGGRGNGMLRVHRVMYEMFAGPIPEGMEIDHLCRTRHCVNVAHLEVVTHGENNRRGETVSAINGRKTHCVRGHLFDEANTMTFPSTEGKRMCRICNRERSIAYYRLHRGVRKADRAEVS